MKKTLTVLFDYQKFQCNKKLERIINEVGSSVRVLNLDDLNQVNAAGEVFDNKETNRSTTLENDSLK